MPGTEDGPGPVFAHATIDAALRRVPPTCGSGAARPGGGAPRRATARRGATWPPPWSQTVAPLPRFGPGGGARLSHASHSMTSQLLLGAGPLAWRLACRRRAFESREENRHSLSRSEEHTSELQSLRHLVCRLLLE